MNFSEQPVDGPGDEPGGSTESHTTGTPDADGPADSADGRRQDDPTREAPTLEYPDDHIDHLGSGMHP